MQIPSQLGTLLQGIALATAFLFAPQCVHAQSPNFARVNFQDSVGSSDSESSSSIPPIITPVQAETPAPPKSAAPQPPTDPLLFATDRVRVKFGLSGLAQSSGVLGSWWNLSEDYAPDSGYDPDRAWGELWIKPAITTDTLRILHSPRHWRYIPGCPMSVPAR